MKTPYLIYRCLECSYPHVLREDQQDYHEMRNLMIVGQYPFCECSLESVRGVYRSMLPDNLSGTVRCYLLGVLEEVIHGNIV